MGRESEAIDLIADSVYRRSTTVSHPVDRLRILFPHCHSTRASGVLLEGWRGEREGIERRERCRGEKTKKSEVNRRRGRGGREWRSLVCSLVAVDGVAFALSADIGIINFPTTGGEDVFVPLVPSPLDHLARVRLVLLHSDILNHSEISRERDRERGREREP
jgi:hypothetical protein